MTSADELLSTVRGRRLCFEVALRSPVGQAVARAMFGPTMRVREERGDAGWLVSYLGPGDPAEILSGPPLAETLAFAAATPVAPEVLLPALSRTVDSAMYWQPRDAEDVVLADPAIRATLVPIAEAVLTAAEAQWWSAPLARSAQVLTRFEPTPPAPHPGATAAERLRRWRRSVEKAEHQLARFQADHPFVRPGGSWWVTPALAGLTATTRSLPDGSAALWLTEDELGWESALLTPCTVDDARVLEITGPADWASLVAAYPLDVTASRRPDWLGVLEASDGTWQIPDWAAVAEEFDGVHVTVIGWLTTSGQTVELGHGATTTLAGWDPDATWWLADVLHPAGGDQPGGDQRWVRDEDRGWHASPRSVGR